MTTISAAVPVRRRGWAWLRGAAGAGVVVLGLAAACAAHLLAWAARAYCDAAFEPAHRFGMNLMALPLAGLSVVVAIAGWWAGRAATRDLALAWRGLLPLVSLLLALGLLIWAYVAAVGTPDGYPGDSGLCPDTNVPPRWPSWLPA
ncbi:hypothetical protein [Kitasatospora sp. A2-31]|uniref:hypothetical protein n=1 Tax=Kitasatospora sp. A2-31 TaxID=2916414 RepID=UPI001EEF6F69|nr:hypothetical protein [Kitasatospora sp. A2-31]MCG6498770.1 hypothetical protein [Kitasatospora sp. A2-31]